MNNQTVRVKLNRVVVNRFFCFPADGFVGEEVFVNDLGKGLFRIGIGLIGNELAKPCVGLL